MKKVFLLIKHESNCGCGRDSCGALTVYWEGTRPELTWTESIKEAKEYHSEPEILQAIEDYCTFFSNSKNIWFSIYEVYKPIPICKNSLPGRKN
jgi:hypothetical protein